MITKVVEIAGEKYTLTAKRSIIAKLNEVCPEVLVLKKEDLKNISRKEEVDISIRLSANMDILFYDLIRTAHPNLSKEESDEIYDKFLDEYVDAENSLMKFIKSVFTGGIPKENKKQLNW
jgi:hypothetical protein